MTGADTAARYQVLTWCKGPPLAAWLLEPARAGTLHLTDNERRIVRHWQAGRISRPETVDRFLVHLGLHLADLPGNIFISGRGRWPTRAPRALRALTPRLRREAAARYLATPRGGRQALAAEYGVQLHTLRRWSKRLEEGTLR